jgi:hypothetical protein
LRCPLIEAFFGRLFVDLNKSTINQYLIDEAGGFREDARNTDEFTSSRVAFCCEKTLRSIAAQTLKGKAEEVPLGIKPVDVARIEAWRAALRPLLDHYGIEVAEVKMVGGARGSEQFAQSADERQLGQLNRALRMLAAAQCNDAKQVGTTFYDFLYIASRSSEGLVKWARTFLEVHDGE